jgi:hypothetical protein
LLALVVIMPACRGGLVSAASRTQLLLPHSLPAAVTAIALASIATRTHREKRVASGVNASPNAKALNSPLCWHSTVHSQHNTATDDRTDDCAFGAMMSLAIG